MIDNIFQLGKNNHKHALLQLNDKEQSDSLQAAQLTFRKFSDPGAASPQTRAGEQQALKQGQRRGRYLSSRSLRNDNSLSTQFHKFNFNSKSGLNYPKSNQKLKAKHDISEIVSHTQTSGNVSPINEGNPANPRKEISPIDIAVVAANLANSYVDDQTPTSTEFNTVHRVSKGDISTRKDSSPEYVGVKDDSKYELIDAPSTINSHYQGTGHQVPGKNINSIAREDIFERRNSDTALARMHKSSLKKKNEGIIAKNKLAVNNHINTTGLDNHSNEFQSPLSHSRVELYSSDSPDNDQYTTTSPNDYSDVENILNLAKNVDSNSLNVSKFAPSSLFEKQKQNYSTSSIGHPNVPPKKVTYQGTLPDLIPNYTRNSTLGKIKAKLLRSAASKTIVPIKSTVTEDENGKTFIKTQNNTKFKSTMRQHDNSSGKEYYDTANSDKDLDEYDSYSDEDDFDSDDEDGIYTDSKNDNSSKSKISSQEDNVKNRVRTLRQSEIGHNFYSPTSETGYRNKFDEDRPWRSHQDLFIITTEERKRYEGMWVSNRYRYLSLVPWYQKMMDGEEVEFQSLPDEGLIMNQVVKDIWLRSNLPIDLLIKIYNFVDKRRDATLDRDSFIVGMWLVDQCLYGRKLPKQIPNSVWNSTNKYNMNKITRATAKNLKKQKEKLRKKEMKLIKKENKLANTNLEI
ncbi:hypothetical protein TPHA_0I02790 [Tetrapisispora phaffii CBS 4417]|uniref:EH domain-containing protein n=1 Tax=Tetrapisispora phaffii (strain ATCC 24235 / CBS 4417 / NBRC 1672 / NRRL Y-8282 / UCD 70-5) TaxID=1071381 RepID=G8BY02_TETPH|nr:hypothetical protein TPHA_0I02790 [Tetrapisispora phaffii CBS 4417]CCE64780.1 hypothetical protein TPHA_0I02790 [Tetrapisispora phaffii CBS 4417]